MIGCASCRSRSLLAVQLLAFTGFVRPADACSIMGSIEPAPSLVRQADRIALAKAIQSPLGSGYVRFIVKLDLKGRGSRVIDLGGDLLPAEGQRSDPGSLIHLDSIPMGCIRRDYRDGTLYLLLLKSGLLVETIGSLRNAPISSTSDPLVSWIKGCIAGTGFSNGGMGIGWILCVFGIPVYLAVLLAAFVWGGVLGGRRLSQLSSTTSRDASSS